MHCITVLSRAVRVAPILRSMTCMPGHDIVVVGGSAGAVKALADLVRQLPADLPAAVFVVVHVPVEPISVLPKILDNAGPLTAAPAQDGELIRPGRIYVAPSDRH